MATNRIPLRHGGHAAATQFVSDPFSVTICHLTMLEISKHNRCERIMTAAKFGVWMTWPDIPCNIRKLLDSENFEMECICSTLVLKANFEAQEHLLTWELGDYENSGF